MPSWFRDHCDQLRQAGLFREPRLVELLPGGRVLRDGRELLHFASNDYLGLATHPKVVAAAVEAASQHGVGSRAGALVTLTRQQANLQDALADLEGTEAALVFPSGYAANLGTVAALVGSGDTVFCDKENHACLVDGCRLSGARLQVFRRDDLTKLNDRLSSTTEGRKLIVTDGVFSMDGTLAALPELLKIAERHDAMLLVDEAHGTGVFGPNARGACDHYGLASDLLIRTGTLSKAIGCQGGFVAGGRDLIHYLWNMARTQMFSTGLAIPVCAAATAAVELIRSGQVRYDFAKLAVMEPFRSIKSEPAGPIVPVVIGDRDETLKVARQLEAAGCLVGAIREPTVPRGTSRLRITITRSHAVEEVAGLAEVLRSLPIAGLQ